MAFAHPPCSEILFFELQDNMDTLHKILAIVTSIIFLLFFKINDQIELVLCFTAILRNKIFKEAGHQTAR